jgi:hypothetical protein
MVTISGGGFLPDCGPPGSGAPCFLVIEFLGGGGCGRVSVSDQLGIGGGGLGVLGFAPENSGSLFGAFFATTDKYGTFSLNILLGSMFSAINYSIVGSDGLHEFCIDPFTIILQLCVIQFGVEQPDGVTSWLPGYVYLDLPPSSCPDVTGQYVDGSGAYGGTIVFHQFVQNRTFSVSPRTIVQSL